MERKGNEMWRMYINPNGNGFLICIMEFHTLRQMVEWAKAKLSCTKYGYFYGTELVYCYYEGK